MRVRLSYQIGRSTGNHNHQQTLFHLQTTIISHTVLQHALSYLDALGPSVNLFVCTTPGNSVEELPRGCEGRGRGEERRGEGEEKERGKRGREMRERRAREEGRRERGGERGGKERGTRGCLNVHRMCTCFPLTNINYCNRQLTTHDSTILRKIRTSGMASRTPLSVQETRGRPLHTLSPIPSTNWAQSVQSSTV